LKHYLADKKDNAKIVVVAHNHDYEFTISLGDGTDYDEYVKDNYETILFYVDELCKSDMAENEHKQ
jgi:hypothetical protein